VSERNYPIHPRPDNDPRFTLGLVIDVADVLEQRGYPETSPGDLIELQQALYRFIYGTEATS
jgi:hypothetical protein